jgi:hypothetical protein
MFIERIKIQYHIHQALSQAKKLEPKISKAAEEAFKTLSKAYQDLKAFNLKHSIFHKIFRWIDRRFGFDPLNREIQRVKPFIPVEQPIPPLPPLTTTPKGSVEVSIPSLPSQINQVEGELSSDSTTIEYHPDEPISTIQPEIEQAIGAFQAKYADCFANDPLLLTTLRSVLDKLPAEKRLEFLNNLTTYQEKTGTWVPAENYLPLILNKPESLIDLCEFMTDVYDKRSEIDENDLEEKMELYVEELFDFGLYRLPEMEKMLTPERFKPYLLNDQFEGKSNAEYIKSIQEELDGTNHFLLPYLKDYMDELSARPQE